MSSTRTVATSVGPVTLSVAIDDQLAEKLQASDSEEQPPEDLQEWLRKQSFRAHAAREPVLRYNPSKRGGEYIPLEQPVTPEQWHALLSKTLHPTVRLVLTTIREQGYIDATGAERFRLVDKVNNYFTATKVCLRLYRTTEPRAQPRHYRLFLLA